MTFTTLARKALLTFPGGLDILAEVYARWIRSVNSAPDKVFRLQDRMDRLYAARREQFPQLDAHGQGNVAREGWARTLTDYYARHLPQAADYPLRRELNLRLNRLEAEAEAPVLRSYPPRAYIEVSNRCNLECTICGRSMYWGKAGQDLDPRLVDKLRDVFPYQSDISLFGYGESLLSPYFAAILAQVPPGIYTRLITNGLLLTEKNIRLLIEHQLSVVHVSLETLREDTYEFIRGASVLGQVQDNLRLMSRLKSETGSALPELRIGFVVMRRNLEELPAFVDWAARLGVAGVSVNYLMVQRRDLLDESLLYHPERVGAVFAEAQRRAVAQRLDLQLPDPLPPNLSADEVIAHAEEQFTACREPWNFVYICSDGKVVPCCMNSKMVLGDLQQQSLDEIWNGRPYQNLRRTINHQRTHPNCRECALSLNVGITDLHRHVCLIDENNLPVKL